MNKKVLVLVNDNFEDVELGGPIDLLVRSQKVDIEYVSPSCSKEKNFITSSKMKFKIENVLPISSVIDKLEEYDLLFIPGGPHVQTLINDKKVDELVLKFNALNSKYYIACICAAPSILGKLGLLKNLDYTVFPGCDGSFSGNNLNTGVVLANKYLTGKSMGYSIDFGVKMLELLVDKNTFDQVTKSVYYKM